MTASPDIEKTPLRAARSAEGDRISSAAAAGKRFGTARLLTWGLYAVVLIVAPLVFESPFSRSMLSQIGIAIVACLSFNILLGQGGMLSFGHAVYTGLGAFCAVHAINMIGAGSLPIPVSLVPLVGGVAGAFFAVLLGYVTTKKAGTPFAMITLGIGMLVSSMSLMIPEFFGGEVGVSTNRVVGQPFMGINYGSAVQVYYLLAIYTLLCTIGMFAFTGTPLGRMLNAVRDNPERVEYIGYEMQRVRFLSFVVAGFFAGVSGGMYAMNFEIATAEVVGLARSGGYLLFTFLGGATVFFGPIIGAVLMVLAFVLLSELTKAWLLYLGLIFTLMVMFAPGGIASLLLMNVRLAKFGKLGRLVGPYVGVGLTGLLAALGGAALIEMIYHLQLNMGGPELRFFGVHLDVKIWSDWIGALAVFVVGGLLFLWARRRFAAQWNAVQTEIARLEAQGGARA